MLDDATRSKMQRILAQELHSLEATELTALWERFTEPSRGLFTRRLKVMAKGEEVRSVKGVSGRDYELEIGGICGARA